MSRKILIVAMALLAVAACSPPKRPQMTPMAGYVVIKEQAVALRADLPGRTSPFAVSEVRPQITGIVKARLFTEGSVVKAGQPLYQIDPAPYRAAYDSATAVLNSAKLKADRYTQLLQAGAIAPQNNDDAQSAYKLAVANADAARINLNYTRIVASISGRIGASTVTSGALVTANQATALATISTLDPIYVDIDQSSAELLAMKRSVQSGDVENANSADVKLTLDDGSTYAHDGKLQFTDVTVDAATGSVRLRAIFPNPEGVLLPGLYVRATILEGTDMHGILVPQPAVSRDAKGNPTVLVLDDKDFARLREIKTGRAIGGDWQVLDGLKAGDKLIVQGLMSIRPDMQVKSMEANKMPPPGAGGPPDAPGAAAGKK